MLCSGRYAVAQRAGSCMAIVFVLGDVFGNEHSSFSWSFSLMHLPLFCLLPGLSPAHPAGKGCCSPSRRGQGSAVSTQRCESNGFIQRLSVSVGIHHLHQAAYPVPQTVSPKN